MDLRSSLTITHGRAAIAERVLPASHSQRAAFRSTGFRPPVDVRQAGPTRAGRRSPRLEAKAGSRIRRGLSQNRHGLLDRFTALGGKHQLEMDDKISRDTATSRCALPTKPKLIAVLGARGNLQTHAAVRGRDVDAGARIGLADTNGEPQVEGIIAFLPKEERMGADVEREEEITRLRTGELFALPSEPNP